MVRLLSEGFEVSYFEWLCESPDRTVALVVKHYYEGAHNQRKDAFKVDHIVTWAGGSVRDKKEIPYHKWTNPSLQAICNLAKEEVARFYTELRAERQRAKEAKKQAELEADEQLFAEMFELVTSHP